jgi:hypothetical protein
VALGLLGFAWADGEEMGRLPPQPPTTSTRPRRPSWNPRSPAEGIEFLDDFLVATTTEAAVLVAYLTVDLSKMP